MQSPFYSIVIFLFILTLPLQALIVIAVIVTSGRPVLFRQRRIGKHGKPFWLYKFRTMVVGAEAKQRILKRRNESAGPTFKIGQDPRFTPVGSFLSHTGLDELPQFINVLRGDMALIGPRPLPIAEARLLKPWMREREEILPGIISPAILRGDYHEDFDAWMKSDVSYVHDKSLATDTLLFVRALPFMVLLCVKEIARRSPAKNRIAL